MFVAQPPIKSIFKSILYCFFLLIVQSISFAQVPLMFNYQGVARNASGSAIANQNVGLKFSLLQGSASGAVIYTETHTATTDGVGLFTVKVGTGTSPTPFSSINWSLGNFWLKTEADLTGGTNYLFLGAMQMASVPYAIIAQTVAPNLWILAPVPYYDESDWWIFPYDTIVFLWNNHVNWIDGTPEPVTVRIDTLNLTNTGRYISDSIVVPYTTDRGQLWVLRFAGSDTTIDAAHNHRAVMSFNTVTGIKRYFHLRIRIKDPYDVIPVTTKYYNCTNASDNHNVNSVMSLAGMHGLHTMDIHNFMGQDIVATTYFKDITKDAPNEWRINIFYPGSNGTFIGLISYLASEFTIDCPVYQMSSGGTCEVKIIKQ